MSYRILAINPGSTSTKIAIYENNAEIRKQSLSHSTEELSQFSGVIEQFEYRLDKIKDFLTSTNMNFKDFDAVVGRGGMLKPVISGTYLVNNAMLSDLKTCKYGSHASNLGAILASKIAGEVNCPAYIVDPIVVDELAPIARITGRPEITRKSVFHALNQKAVAKRFAKTLNRPYSELNLIVAHLGGGISVGCHDHGRIVDVNNSLDGQGPFSPERAGTIPAGQFAEEIISENLSSTIISKNLAGKGGLVAHLGTNDAREVEMRIAAGDATAKLVYNAMIYQIARYIAAAAVPVCGKVDYIILTGGIAYSEYLTSRLQKYVSFISPVEIIPGENELQALAEGAYRVLSGEEIAKEYT